MRNHYSAFAIAIFIPVVITTAQALVALPSISSTAHATSTPPIGKVALKTPVEISFMEPLDPKDTTSSRRFKEEYEPTIATGVKLTAAHGAWVIVGPRRSNHYMLLAKGAPDTPSVSLMASLAADEALRRIPRSR